MKTNKLSYICAYRGIEALHHLDDLTSIYQSIETRGGHQSVLFPVEQLIPPAEEEVTSDQFEPRREGVT